ncbi:MAG: hypothetical protein KGD57_04085 [Candidatus Lokiarchaeota archaeon]|nr:hypothetical protein [Candidatus Lokiarchaeota archaeon]
MSQIEADLDKDYFDICDEFVKNTIENEEIIFDGSICKIIKKNSKRYIFDLYTNMYKKSFKKILKEIFNDIGYNFNIINKNSRFDVFLN